MVALVLYVHKKNYFIQVQLETNAIGSTVKKNSSVWNDTLIICNDWIEYVNKYFIFNINSYKWYWGRSEV